MEGGLGDLLVLRYKTYFSFGLSSCPLSSTQISIPVLSFTRYTGCRGRVGRVSYGQWFTMWWLGWTLEYCLVTLRVNLSDLSGVLIIEVSLWTPRGPPFRPSGLMEFHLEWSVVRTGVRSGCFIVRRTISWWTYTHLYVYTSLLTLLTLLDCLCL